MAGRTFSIQEENAMKVYADNAATTKISPAARAAMNTCMQECWGNPSSLHWAG